MHAVCSMASASLWTPYETCVPGEMFVLYDSRSRQFKATLSPHERILCCCAVDCTDLDEVAKSMLCKSRMKTALASRIWLVEEYKNMDYRTCGSAADTY